MIKFLVVGMAVISISVFAWMYFPSADNISKKIKQNTAENTIFEAAVSEKSTKNSELYDLKSSINHIISDSVQEEIQQAVQEEVLKTTKSSERE